MLMERCVSVRIRGAEVMVRTAAGFGILCSTSPVIAKGKTRNLSNGQSRGPRATRGGRDCQGHILRPLNGSQGQLEKQTLIQQESTHN